MSRAWKFISYIGRKLSDLASLGRRDVQLADLVVRAHAEKAGVEVRPVPLSLLRQIHPLDRDEAAATLRERVRRLENVKGRLLEKKLVTREDLARHVPSVSWIKVVPADGNRYIVFEGNGRLAALRRAMGEADVSVEVEVYDVPRRLSRKAMRIRRLYRLTDGENRHD